MVQHHSDSSDFRSQKLDDSSDNSEKWMAAARPEEPVVYKIGSQYESPENVKLLGYAPNPTGCPGGTLEFYRRCGERLEEQAQRMKAPDCTAGELEEMHNNNIYLIYAQSQRITSLIEPADKSKDKSKGSFEQGHISFS